MEHRNVTIHRSGIENFLMTVKEFIKSHRRPAAIIALSVVVVTGAVVAGFVYYDKSNLESLHEYEAIVTAYQLSDKSDAVSDKTVKKLTDLVNRSRFGYVHRHGKYIIAGLLFDKKKFEDAQKMYISYADNTDSAFTPLALFQAGICAESLGRSDQAADIYKRIEKDFKDSTYSDRVLYDLGRIAQKKGEAAVARDYFSKLLAQHPNSPFSAQAKARLFMSGMTK